jgi:hypothetical protein
MKKKFRITCTHNPQDFFNGVEPVELTRIYNTDQLETDVSYELNQGYQVIVSEVLKDEE